MNEREKRITPLYKFLCDSYCDQDSPREFAIQWDRTVKRCYHCDGEFDPDNTDHKWTELWDDDDECAQIIGYQDYYQCPHCGGVTP